jgi:multiple sugar transport system permease protein
MSRTSVPLSTTDRPATRPGERRPLRWLNQVPLHLLALLWLLITVGPMLWMLSASLKSPGDVLRFPPALIPTNPQWTNYRDVFTQVPFLRYIANSALVSVTVTVAGLVLHSMAGYSLARLRYPGRNLIFIGILSTLMVPSAVLLIPQFILVKDLGWLNSYAGLIVPAIPHAFGIFLMRQFYLGLPGELQEAAIVDGATPAGVFWRIALPLSKPILATLAVFFFLANWNSFLWPLVIIQSPEMWVIQIGITQFVGEHGTQWNMIMAASVVAAVPTLLLFFVLQRYIVEGIKMTGIKM